MEITKPQVAAKARITEIKLGKSQAIFMIKIVVISIRRGENTIKCNMLKIIRN
jgi:hypothetical protein